MFCLKGPPDFFLLTVFTHVTTYVKTFTFPYFDQIKFQKVLHRLIVAFSEYSPYLFHTLTGIIFTAQ